MKLPAVFSVAALAQVSLADFYLFRVEAGGDSGWQISDNPTPDCREMGPHTPWYGAKLVVPGQTLGVTCNGAGCWGNGDPKAIQNVRMHFSNFPPYLWEIKQDRLWKLEAGDGAIQGSCSPATGHTFSCPSNNGKTDNGARKFHCKVYASAADIKGAK